MTDTLFAVLVIVWTLICLTVGYWIGQMEDERSR